MKNSDKHTFGHQKDEKLHFKMYKVHKQWLYAGLVLVGINAAVAFNETTSISRY